MRKHFLAILLCIGCFSFGQSSFKKNAIYLEAGGNGLWGSVNYERQLTKEAGPGIRLGLGMYTENAFYLTFPVALNYLFKLKNNRSFIDASLGITWAGIDDKSSLGLYFTNFVPAIGYRKQTTKDLIWRISFSPVINKYGFVP